MEQFRRESPPMTIIGWVRWILIGCAVCLASVNHVPGQIIETIVGAGPNAFGGDGVPPTESGLNEPNGIVFDANGRLLIADSQNHRIRYISDNQIHTLIGTGIAGWSESEPIRLVIGVGLGIGAVLVFRAYAAHIKR